MNFAEQHFGELQLGIQAIINDKARLKLILQINLVVLPFIRN